MFIYVYISYLFKKKLYSMCSAGNNKILLNFEDWAVLRVSASWLVGQAGLKHCSGPQGQCKLVSRPHWPETL